MDSTARRILIFDSAGGLCVGSVVLALSSFVSQLYGLPTSVVWFVGSANIVYGLYSGSLVRAEHSLGQLGRPWVTALVVANLAWSGVCVSLLVRHWSTVTPLGVLSLAFEALFVGGLAGLEFIRVRPFTVPRDAVSARAVSIVVRDWLLGSTQGRDRVVDHPTPKTVVRRFADKAPNRLQ